MDVRVHHAANHLLPGGATNEKSHCNSVGGNQLRQVSGKRKRTQQVRKFGELTSKNKTTNWAVRFICPLSVRGS